MTKVFIGGSRSVTRLGPEVRRRLDRIVQGRLPVVIGDANGADKAVQLYLQSRGHENVEVFCMEGKCRNNLGNWPIRTISAPAFSSGFEYYSAKDAQMTVEGTVGLMLWDGRSRGTLANVFRLIDNKKKVVVYVAPARAFENLITKRDLEEFLARFGKDARARAVTQATAVERPLRRRRQVGLF